MNASMAVSALLLVVLLAWPHRAAGTTWRVNPQGTGDAPTVQAAIDSAALADTVLFAAGVYPAFNLRVAKGILLRAEADTAAVLDGGFNGRILTVESPDPVTLEDLVFSFGRQQGVETNHQGGAIGAFQSHLTVRGCVFRTNVVSGWGGAIFASSFAPLASGEAAAVPALVLSRTLFESNFSGGDGGAVFADEIPLLVEDCVFRGNVATLGGALAMINRSHFVLRSVFERNNGFVAGAIDFSGDGTLRLEGTLLQGNTATNFAGGLSAVNAGLVELERSWFVGNLVFSGGGAGGGARFRNTPVVGNRVLWQENSSEGFGGALHLEQSSAGTFSYSTWIGNTAPDGASFSVSEGSLTLDHSLLADPYSDAGACAGSTTSGSCLVGAAETGVCANMPFVQRVAVEPCEAALDSLCPVPAPLGCGPVGHADLECGNCLTPVRPTTWGRLKDLYRR